MDDVQLAAEPQQSARKAGDERGAEQRSSIRRADPTVDLKSSILLVVDRVAGDRPREDADGMPPARQFDPLSQGLAFGAAGEGVEVADDQSDAERAIGVSRWSVRGRS